MNLCFTNHLLCHNPPWKYYQCKKSLIQIRFGSFHFFLVWFPSWNSQIHCPNTECEPPSHNTQLFNTIFSIFVFLSWTCTHPFVSSTLPEQQHLLNFLSLMAAVGHPCHLKSTLAGILTIGNLKNNNILTDNGLGSGISVWDLLKFIQ